MRRAWPIAAIVLGLGLVVVGAYLLSRPAKTSTSNSKLMRLEEALQSRTENSTNNLRGNSTDDITTCQGTNSTIGT